MREGKERTEIKKEGMKKGEEDRRGKQNKKEGKTKRGNVGRGEEKGGDSQIFPEKQYFKDLDFDNEDSSLTYETIPGTGAALKAPPSVCSHGSSRLADGLIR